MSEPKKRGRPSKADIAAREPKISTFSSANTHGTPVTGPVQFYRDPFDVSLSQAYALRVWNGQSSTADRPWRIQRVKEALHAQGLSMEGVELP